jgi:hypothetical protein
MNIPQAERATGAGGHHHEGDKGGSGNEAAAIGLLAHPRTGPLA